MKTIVIDAGHGGKDPGCHGKSAKEKDVALAISLRLGKFIEDHLKDVKVIYTRKTDVFIELNERANIANRNEADLFICIHCNSACYRDKKTKKDVCKPEVHGSETYVMGLHKTAGNLAVAARENESALLEADYEKKYESLLNSDEAMMVLSVYQNVYRDQSINFADKVQQEFKDRCARKDKGVNDAGFLVLWKTAMPSVLIETGFLTNPAEEKFLASESGQDYMATAIFRALRQWRDEVEDRKVVYDDEIQKQKPYVAPAEPVADTTAKKDTAKAITNTSPPKNDPPKQDSQKKDPPKQDPVVKSDVKPVFKVQFLSSEKMLDAKSAKFKDLNDVTWYQADKLYKYVVGTYATSAEAKKRQTEMRSNGFPEAFVVAFLEGKRIPVSDAEKLLR